MSTLILAISALMTVLLSICALVLRARNRELRRHLERTEGQIEWLRENDPISHAIDVAMAEKDAAIRLRRLVSLSGLVRDLQGAKHVSNMHTELMRDYIDDCLEEPTIDVGTLLNVIEHWWELSEFDRQYVTGLDFNSLGERLKGRLIRVNIESFLSGVKIDERELMPRYQEIFFSIEKEVKRQVENQPNATFSWVDRTEEKRRILSEKYEIEDWKDVRELNPDLIFD